MTTGLQVNVAVSVAVCVGLALVSRAIISRYRKKEWRHGGKIKRLLIYPFKSLPPFEVAAAELTLEGLRYKRVKDREFLLLDADQNNKFITARSEPSLLLIDVSFDEERSCLRITSRNPQVDMSTLEVPTGPNEGVDTSTVLHVNTWERNGAYAAHPCDQKVSAWFSKYLSKNVLAVRLIAPTEPRSWNLPKRFHDTAGVNILSERSVDNLVDLIRDPCADITFKNFRPSILLETRYPYEEDFWQRVKIGDAETEFHSRCQRCVLTTINPESALKSDKEPLVTLRKFRVDRSAEGISKYNFQPLFSSHHMVRLPGNIYVGQTVLVDQAARELL